MKRYLLICSGACLLIFIYFLVIWPGYSARGQLDSFIIESADATNTFSMTGSAPLTTLIQNVAPRFVLQYANAKNILPMVDPPQALVTLIQSVEDRFVLQYANAKNVFPLMSPAVDFIASMQNIEDRFVLQYANASNTLVMNYPIDVIGDTTAPTIISITAVPTGSGINLVVTTSEYTTAQLDYGQAPGSYSVTLYKNEYQTEHHFLLTNLQAEVTYYYQVIVTDRSDNTTQSAEGTFELPTGIYLPILAR
jgi:hypothetical protein